MIEYLTEPRILYTLLNWFNKLNNIYMSRLSVDGLDKSIIVTNNAFAEVLKQMTPDQIVPIGQVNQSGSMFCIYISCLNNSK